jgi:hypothetical protein
MMRWKAPQPPPNCLARSAMTKKASGLNPSNRTVELSRQVGQLKIRKERKNTKLHDIYLADPTARFVMSFAEFKKRWHRRGGRAKG